VDNPDNTNQIEVFVNDCSDNLLITCYAQGRLENLNLINEAYNNYLDKETSFEKGKYLRIIGPLIGFR
jgi:hypothetical protein